MCANPTEHTCIPPRPPVLQAEDAQEEEERLKREDANLKKEEEEEEIVLYQSDGLGLPMPGPMRRGRRSGPAPHVGSYVG